MATYKTKDGVDRVLPGIGRTVDGKITTDFKIENPMFELVEDSAPPVPPAPAVATPAVALAPQVQTQTPNQGVN